MNELKYTPGPWDAYHVNDHGLWCIARKDNGVTIGVFTANANLIASAPDLYEAGMEMAEAVAQLPADDGRILGLLPVLCRLRSAIAMAEGRTI